MVRGIVCGAVVALVLAWIQCGDAIKVLGVFPMASHSHYTIGFRLMKELVDRGHEVTFINSYPQKKPIKNLVDVPVAGFVEEMNKSEWGVWFIFVVDCFCFVGRVQGEHVQFGEDAAGAVRALLLFDG